jgi:hypothetical protein
VRQVEVDGSRGRRYCFAMRIQFSLVSALWLAVCVGCADKQLTPVMVSSAGGSGYALGYPEATTSAANKLVADMTQASLLSQKLGARTGDLKSGADPELLLIIVAQADEAGRGQAFAAAHGEDAAVRGFWEEERGPITGRVSGAAQKQVTEAGCTQAEVGGAVSYALKEGIDRQLEKRLRANNEAQRTIERNKATLGQANFSALQRLADDIAVMSYLVNSALVEDRDGAQYLLSEQGDVDSTLEDAIDNEHRWQQEKGATGAELKASQALVAELEKSRAGIEPAVAKAKAALQKIETEIKAARGNYETGLTALQDAIRALPPPNASSKK